MPGWKPKGYVCGKCHRWHEYSNPQRETAWGPGGVQYYKQLCPLCWWQPERVRAYAGAEYEWVKVERRGASG